MTKREPNDYSAEDVRNFIAKQHQLTYEQVIALDFPPPDYHEQGQPFWSWAKVYEWLQPFHLALIVSERASNPDAFEEFARIVRGFLRGRK